MSERQKELKLFRISEADPNVPFLISILQGRDWTTAREVSRMVYQRTKVEWIDRKVRALANASKGQICGGQKGYKLVTEMTVAEYQHWRNWMMSQANEMKSRVMESDKIFYGRQPVLRVNLCNL